jgi:hypothetical protein
MDCARPLELHHSPQTTGVSVAVQASRSSLSRLGQGPGRRYSFSLSLEHGPPLYLLDHPQCAISQTKFDCHEPGSGLLITRIGALGLLYLASRPVSQSPARMRQLARRVAGK